MKTFQLFYQTFNQVTQSVDNIFSLGFNQRKHFLNWSAPLFFLGKFAKYTIGFSLGIVLASFAVIINLIIESPQTERNFSPPHADSYKNFQVLSSSSSNIQGKSQPIFIESTKTQAVLSKAEKISQEALQDKKDELHRVINLLTSLLGQKINSMAQEHEIHTKNLKHYYQLRSNLRHEKHLAHHAEQFSHYLPGKKADARCICGSTFFGLCSFCQTSAIFVDDEKAVPIYIPDKARRHLARLSMEKISKKMAHIANILEDTLPSYELVERLYSIKNSLQHLQIDTQLSVTTLLFRFKEILDNTLPYFTGDSLKKSDFVPKSQRSQVFVASKMLGQLQRNTWFFEQLPNELIEKILIAIAIPDFSKDDLRNIWESATIARF